MKWIKKGRIFVSKNNFDWMQSHAAPPVCDYIGNDTVRIYFSARDKKGRSRPTYIEVDALHPENIKYINDQPILELGRLGTFDDNGIMPSWIINDNGVKKLYYIGWNPQQTVSYKLAIGLAISEDGRIFKKYSEGPILDRSIEEPYFNTAPCVIRENGKWKMWYVSCTEWKIIKNSPEPVYNIKYATSKDGINWHRTGKVCIDFDKNSEAIGKPCVYKDLDIYKMIYSYRKSLDYRTNKKNSYRFGYAESKDGLNWKRKDCTLGLKRSEKGWDSLMMEYSSTYVYKNTRYLIYNGNGFGESGFGYAILENG